MNYRVDIPEEILNAIDAQLAYFRQEQVPQRYVDAWFRGIFDRMLSLEQWPRRFPVAQAVSAVKSVEIRRMNYREHAIFYRIIEHRQLVKIIALRHGRRRPWLEDAEES